MDVREAWYALGCAQVGARAGMRLLEHFGDPAAVFAATPRAWTVEARLTAAACQRLLAAANRDHAGELARLERLGIAVIGLTEAAYPARLRTIPDPPTVLFVKGALLPDDARAVAVVGSRRASPYGRHVSAELGAGLAERGVTVVSGMALGADAAAHEGCLRAGGRTIAVLGCGIDIVYPPEHTDLYARIAAAGAVVSEFPPGASPTRGSFPQRNRIISGLALGVVVVEAPENSGALITAEHAMEQGRDVFAVPGSVNSEQSRGTHKLLRDGARLVESVDDILEELQLPAPGRSGTALSGPSWDAFQMTDEAPAPAPEPPKPKKTAPQPAPPPVAPAPAVSPEEARLLDHLSTAAIHVDDLVDRAGLPPAQVSAALLMLELKGLVQRRPGNVYVRMG